VDVICVRLCPMVLILGNPSLLTANTLGFTSNTDLNFGVFFYAWHTLRHTFASRLVVTVRELLGHSGISVTMRYAHTNIESKRAAVEKLYGFGDNLVTVGPRVRQLRALLSLNQTASYNVSRG
jgi:hypothetical protein